VLETLQLCLVTVFVSRTSSHGTLSYTPIRSLRLLINSASFWCEAVLFKGRATRQKLQRFFKLRC